MKIGRLASGGIITNYFCTSACRHCLYNCGPHWEKRYISVEVAEKNFRAVKALGCSAVHIGGGEPMLRPEELGAVLDAARRSGVSIDYVETNSSWFKDPESAEAALSGLRPKGLYTLLVSISPFHNEHIPFARTQGVMDAARRAGVRIFPWVAEFIPDLSAFDASRSHALSEFEERHGKDYVRRILDRYWIHMGGRALETFRPLLRTKTLEHILRENTTNCGRELTDTSHFHLDLFGGYIPGLCSGLTIKGDDLGNGLSPDKYPILNILGAEGIRGLFDFAVREYGFQPQQAGYINKCDLCTEIRFFLVKEGCVRSKELGPEEFYLRRSKWEGIEMKCDGCGTGINPGDEKEHCGRTLCEDCYMDSLSPTRVCDPWAVYSATNFEKQIGGSATLTPIQSEILAIVRETGGIERSELLQKLGGRLDLKQLEREFAVLRHLEKVRGEKAGDRILIKPW